MATVGSMWVSMKARTNKFERKLNRATRGIRKFVRAAFSIKKIALGSVLGGFGAAKFAQEVGEAAERLDLLAKTGAKLGITTEALAGLQFAGEQTGVSIQTLNKGLQNMIRQVADAADGTGEAKQAIVDLGLNAAQLTRLSPEKQFARIAEAMRAIENPSKRVQIAFDVFGGRATALLNTLALGSDGLREMAEDAKRLGIAVSGIETAQVEMMNDAVNRVKKTFQGLSNRIAILVAPLVQELADRFVAFATDGQRAQQLIIRGFRFVVKVIDRVLEVTQFVVFGWRKLKAGIAEVKFIGASWGISLLKILVDVEKKIIAVTKKILAASKRLTILLELQGQIANASLVRTAIDKMIDNLDINAKVLDSFKEGLGSGLAKLAQEASRLNKEAAKTLERPWNRFGKLIESLAEKAVKRAKVITKARERIPLVTDTRDKRRETKKAPTRMQISGVPFAQRGTQAAASIISRIERAAQDEQLREMKQQKKELKAIKENTKEMADALREVATATP